jgi:hypothetical protein
VGAAPVAVEPAEAGNFPPRPFSTCIISFYFSLKPRSFFYSVALFNPYKILLSYPGIFGNRVFFKTRVFFEVVVFLLFPAAKKVNNDVPPYALSLAQKCRH